MDLKAIGQRIKQARENAHITQEGLAAAIGCTSQHMSVIERGLKAPRLDTFVTIANTLNISSDVLLQDVLVHTEDPLAGEISAVLAPLPQELQLRILRALCAFSEVDL